MDQSIKSGRLLDCDCSFRRSEVHRRLSNSSLLVSVAADRKSCSVVSAPSSFQPEGKEKREMALGSKKWGYMRIITGTILGGVLGFYVMHRMELSYKEKMNKRLRQYEKELRKKEEVNKLEESLWHLKLLPFA